MLQNMKLNATATQRETPGTEVALPEGVTSEMVTDAEKQAKDIFKNAPDSETQTETTITAQVIKRDDWPDQSTDEPKITLAMIVRNEEAHLAECLECMKDYVDEIVVVDTGSTDKSIEIAKSFGAKVYEHPWEDSFSIARNWAIYHTKTPWIIQMDADEVMEKQDAMQIRDTMRSAHKSTANLIHLVLINKKKGSAGNITIINSGKIMRVIPSLYFTRRVHNRLHCSGDTRLTNLRIIHYGYALDDEAVMKNKKERTTRLLHIQAEETPEDPETWYYLAIQYLRYEDYDKVIKYGTKAVDLFAIHDPKSQLQLLAIHTIAISYYHKASNKALNEHVARRLFNESIKYDMMALEIYPDYLDSNALLSSIFFALKDYDKCFKYSEKYLQIVAMLKKDQSKAMVIPLNTIKNEWMVYLQLAINFFEQRDSAKAIACIAKSEDLLPMDQKYRPSYGVFKYMITMGDPASLNNAEAIYKTGFRPEQ